MVLIRRQVGMNFDYYYLTQQEPAARNKMDTFFGNLSLQGMEEIRLFIVEGGVLLQNELAAGDGSDDRDLYMALSLYYLAALIKNPKRDYPF